MCASSLTDPLGRICGSPLRCAADRTAGGRQAQWCRTQRIRRRPAWRDHPSTCSGWSSRSACLVALLLLEWIFGDTLVGFASDLFRGLRRAARLDRRRPVCRHPVPRRAGADRRPSVHRRAQRLEDAPDDRRRGGDRVRAGRRLRQPHREPPRLQDPGRVEGPRTPHRAGVPDDVRHRRPRCRAHRRRTVVEPPLAPLGLGGADRDGAHAVLLLGDLLRLVPRRPDRMGRRCRHTHVPRRAVAPADDRRRQAGTRRSGAGARPTRAGEARRARVDPVLRRRARWQPILREGPRRRPAQRRPPLPPVPLVAAARPRRRAAVLLAAASRRARGVRRARGTRPRRAHPAGAGRGGGGTQRVRARLRRGRRPLARPVGAGPDHRRGARRDLGPGRPAALPTASPIATCAWRTCSSASTASRG